MVQDASVFQVPNPQAANETFLSIQPQLERWVETEYKCNGSDPDDLSEIAQDAFLKAYASYDPSRGTAFMSWIHWKLISGLKDYHKKQQRRNQRRATARIERMNLQAPVERTWKEVSEDMSLDAEVVAELAIDPPSDIKSIVKRRGGSSYAWKISIMEALREMGWTSNRIQEAIRQLMEIIRS